MAFKAIANMAASVTSVGGGAAEEHDAMPRQEPAVPPAEQPPATADLNLQAAVAAGAPPDAPEETATGEGAGTESEGDGQHQPPALQGIDTASLATPAARVAAPPADPTARVVAPAPEAQDGAAEGEEAAAEGEGVRVAAAPDLPVPDVEDVMKGQVAAAGDAAAVNSAGGLAKSADEEEQDDDNPAAVDAQAAAAGDQRRPGRRESHSIGAAGVGRCHANTKGARFITVAGGVQHPAGFVINRRRRYDCSW